MSYSGIDKFITTASKNLGRLESKVDVVFYGDKAKKKGIYEKIQAVNSVDVCNIINYYLTQAKTDLIKNQALKDKLSKAQTVARDINEQIENFTTFTTPNNVARKPEDVKSTAPENVNDYTRKEKISNLLNNVKLLSKEFFKEIPLELVSLVPKLGKAKTALQDLLAIGSKYGTAADIPNADIQKIVNTVYDVQNVLKAVEFLDSAQGVVNLLQLQKQIQKLQKFINPARIIPEISAIAKTLRSIQQVVLQVVKIVTLTKAIIKAVSALLKAFFIIQQFFKLLALPNMFTVHGITATLEEARQTVKDKAKEFLELLDKINTLLELIYSFSIGILEIIDSILKEVNILLVNLQACKQINTDNSPVVDELRNTSQALRDSADTLKAFTDTYATAKNNRDKTAIRFGTYTITVIEEEIVDEGKTLKRRRAVAFNDRGLLVLQGDLTFATNTTLLIEELKFKLINEGLAAATDLSLSAEEQYILDTTSSILEVNELTAYDDTSVENMSDVQSEVTSFIDGLKNGVKLRKKAKAKLAQQTATLKSDLANQSPTAGVTSGLNNPSINNTITQNALTNTEKANLQRSYILNRNSADPARRKLAETARLKLQNDVKLRAQLAGG